MFDRPRALELLETYRPLLRRLHAIEETLDRRFLDAGEQARAMVLAVAAGEPLLFVGPPGTAKSRLVRAFCGILGMIDEDEPHKRDESYFEYLLTQFTEPGELFGPFDLQKLTNEQRLERVEDRMLQRAKIVFLDEVFNASSAILNSLLTVINERLLHDRGEIRKVALRCLFGATNEVPRQPELRAFYDRFLLRCEVSNVGDGAAGELEGKGTDGLLARSLQRLLEKGWSETYGHHGRGDLGHEEFFLQLEEFREGLDGLADNRKSPFLAGESRFYERLARMVKEARDAELSEMSNRRIVKGVHAMLVHQLYRYAQDDERELPDPLAPESPEAMLIPKFFLDRRDDPGAVETLERTAKEADG